MMFRIKRRFLSWNIVDEGNRLVAKIKNKRCLGAGKNILDNNGNIVYTTDIINLPKPKELWNTPQARSYKILRGKDIIATASFYCKKETKDNVHQQSLILAKLNDMHVQTPYGIWNIVRQKDNSIIIQNGNEIVGTITSFFALKAQKLNVLSKIDPVFIAGIYVLAVYMMHETDCIAV